MQRAEDEHSLEPFFTGVEKPHDNLLLSILSDHQTIQMRLLKLAQERELTLSLEEISRSLVKARSFTEFSLLINLPPALIQSVLHEKDLHFIELKLNLNQAQLQACMIASPHKTLEAFAQAMQIDLDDMLKYFEERQLHPYWKMRFYSQTVGSLLMYFRPEFKGALPLSIARAADTFGAPTNAFIAEIRQVFQMEFNALVYLLSKIPPEKFYALVKEYGVTLHNCTNTQLFTLITQMSLACNSIQKLFGLKSIPVADPLLLHNPHIIIPFTQHLN